jgi:glycosyltransferase involved in cell wall biosynthesis
MREELRVAILLLNAGRGSGEVARQQAAYLASRGHRVFFLHPGMGEGAPGAINRDVELHSSIIPVHEHLPSAGRAQERVAGMSHASAVAYLQDFEYALESVIDDVDVVYGHHASISAVATANVARRARKPYVLFLHGTGIEPRHERGYDDEIWSLIQDAVESANGILVTTEYVRDRLVRNLIDLPEDRFLVLPCGIDVDEFRPGRDEDVARRFDLPDRYIICPGALTASKGPQNVVEATREYADLAATIFIGDGELREQIEADLDGRGRLLGFVSAADKAALINAASILTAAPEKKEHFGIIYAEGLAAGTPPVAYDGGGVSSIVTPETGVLTKRDPRSLGCAIRALLLDPERLKALAQAGRRRAVEDFSWPELGPRLEEWLARMSSAGGLRPPADG